MQSIDAGFDWGSAAIGAGGMLSLLALGSVAAMAVGGRGRLKTAR